APETYDVSLSAIDPLNLVGIIVPGDRVPALSKRQIIFRNGVPVAEGESQGHQPSIGLAYAAGAGLENRTAGGGI
ncbi:MAG TPA: hypothetical protein VMI06_19020, partial [Terriglobia bacterium]|nr:hypothetical protein [Terriglobia bacterium]